MIARPKHEVLVEVIAEASHLTAWMYSLPGLLVWVDDPESHINSISSIHGVGGVDLAAASKSLVTVDVDRRFDIEEVAQEIRDLFEEMKKDEIPF